MVKKKSRRKTYQKKKTCMTDKPKGQSCYKVKGGWRRRKNK